MNSVWEYKDAIGVTRRGIYAGNVATSGSDVSYRFNRIDGEGKATGKVDMVSGSRLKEAKRIQ